MPNRRLFTYLWMVAALICGGKASVEACPFCPPQSPTLSERLVRSDVAILAQWVSARDGRQDGDGQTTFAIVQVLRDSRRAFTKGERVELARPIGGRAGDLFFLMGRYEKSINWDDPLEISETGYQYLAQAPSPEVPAGQRLKFFAKFLEFPDPLIANDAFAEFAKAAYEDVAPLAKTISRERLRRWILDPATPAAHRGLYGMLIGLCGNASDARLLENIINKPDADFRQGIDGMIGGYLLLTGASGLDVIDQTKLRDKSGATSETYAAMQALRFIWSYGGDRIKKERLRASMRLLLDRPQLAELVITDLARWRDWKVQDRVMELYSDPNYDNVQIKTAIIGYLIASIQDGSHDKAAPPPPHVLQGRTYLERLRQSDPELVRRAERRMP